MSQWVDRIKRWVRETISGGTNLEEYPQEIPLDRDKPYLSIDWGYIYHRGQDIGADQFWTTCRIVLNHPYSGAITRSWLRAKEIPSTGRLCRNCNRRIEKD